MINHITAVEFLDRALVIPVIDVRSEKEYLQGHIPGAVFCDLHVELAKPGHAAATGAAERHYLVPSRDEVAETLRRWGFWRKESNG